MPNDLDPPSIWRRPASRMTRWTDKLHARLTDLELQVLLGELTGIAGSWPAAGGRMYGCKGSVRKHFSCRDRVSRKITSMQMSATFANQLHRIASL